MSGNESGSGGWQITQTNSFQELGVDCVVDGRSETPEVAELFRRAIAGEALPREGRRRIPPHAKVSSSPSIAPPLAWSR